MNTDMQWQRFMTARELELEYGIPKGTSYKLAKQGIIPSYRVGPKLSGVRFIAREVLDALRVPTYRERPTRCRAEDKTASVEYGLSGQTDKSITP